MTVLLVFAQKKTSLDFILLTLTYSQAGRQKMPTFDFQCHVKDKRFLLDIS